MFGKGSKRHTDLEHHQKREGCPGGPNKTYSLSSAELGPAQPLFVLFSNSYFFSDEEMQYSPISNVSGGSSPASCKETKKKSSSKKSQKSQKKSPVICSKIRPKSHCKSSTPKASINKSTLACLIKRKLFPNSTNIIANPPPVPESTYCFHCSFPCRKPPHNRCVLVVNRIRNTIDTFSEQSVEL